MTSTIGEILPVAARRFGARTALLVGDRSFSFDDLRGAVEPRRERPRRGGRRSPATGSRSTARTAGSGSSPTTASPRPARSSSRSTSCSRRTRSATSSRTPARAPSSHRRTRASRCSICAEPGTSRTSCCGATDPARGDRASPTGWRTGAGVQPGRTRDGGDLAAICYTSGTTGHPKGAMQPHRAVIGAAVGTAVMAARGPDDRVINSLPLPHVYGSCVFNAADDGRLDPDHDPALRRGDRAARDRRAPRDADGRRPDRLLLPARPPGLRLLRPVEPDALLGRRPDAAGGQGDRVHRADRLPDPRGLGHDRARRRHQREPGDRPQQARHDRRPVPRQRDARRRHRRSRRARCRSASAAS